MTHRRSRQAAHAVLATSLAAGLVLSAGCSSSLAAPSNHPELWCSDLTAQASLAQLPYIPKNEADAVAVEQAWRALQPHAPAKISKSITDVALKYSEFGAFYYRPGQTIKTSDGEQVIDQDRISEDAAELGGANLNVTGWIDDADSYATTTCNNTTISTWRHHR